MHRTSNVGEIRGGSWTGSRRCERQILQFRLFTAPCNDKQQSLKKHCDPKSWDSAVTSFLVAMQKQNGYLCLFLTVLVQATRGKATSSIYCVTYEKVMGCTVTMASTSCCNCPGLAWNIFLIYFCFHPPIVGLSLHPIREATMVSIPFVPKLYCAPDGTRIWYLLESFLCKAINLNFSAKKSTHCAFCWSI